MEIIFFRSEGGKEPVAEFLDTLTPQQLQKVDFVFRVIEESVAMVPSSLFKKLSGADGIWEIRVSTRGSALRFLSFIDQGRLVVATNGFDKKTRKTPQREIRLAESRKKDYEERV